MHRALRTCLLGVTGLSSLSVPAALAQVSGPRPVIRHTGGIEEIVVTAQKRSQRLQDVPIAVTAISQATLAANRITTVEDLTGAVPNVTVRESGGSAGLPAFTIRGVTSYGVVPGSDKESSIYLDGVYLGSPYGTQFQLPDIQRIEVLRGPQGTLFGRNATSGAISVITRDPDGVLGGRQEFTAGNYGQFRTRTSIDTPQIGPFSAYFSFVHNQRDGDIRNIGAGQTWYRSGPDLKEPSVQVSPRFLGSHDSNSYFVALKYQPTDAFQNVYKFDYDEDHYTPEGVAAIAVNPIGLGPEGNAFLGALLLYGSADTVLDPSARRPDYVNNSWATTNYQRVYGHSLTSTYQVNDSVSIKNIAAYRETFIYSNSELGGLGGLKYPAFFPGGGNGTTPVELFAISTQAETRQISDEVQANYTSKFLTLTTGFLYYHQNGYSGGPRGFANNYVLDILFGGVVPFGNFSTSNNRTQSVAGYAQAEVHITPKLDLVGGIRLNHDEKTGDFVSSGPVVGGVVTNLTDAFFKYENTRPAYSVGVNYKVAHDILVYGKYSNSFVSGGEVGAVPFVPETASSFEAGGKADFLNHRLRTNLAVFNVDYKHLQSAQSGTTVGLPTLGTVIVDGGDETARGFELEVAAKPVDPVTLTGSLGYTHAQITRVGPILESIYGTDYKPTFLPNFTADLSAQYDTPPLYRGAHMIFRMDASWHSKERGLEPSQVPAPGYSVLAYIPQSWLVNTRVALVDIPIGGSHSAEIAGWARNLTNNREPTFPLGLEQFVLSSSFQLARTYGIDINLKF